MRAAFVSALLAVLCAAAALWPSSLTPEVGAQDHIVIRVATLAPRQSPWMRAYDRWDQHLREATNGNVSLRVYGGGVAGDDRQVVQKLESGQLDAASLTITGLGLLVRESLVLSAPGVVEDYDDLAAARAAVTPILEERFEERGYVLLGWGDAGRLRLFSTQVIRTPSDLRNARPWVWTDNPIFVAWLRAAEVRGVPLGPTEVLPGLQTRRIDTVPASALAAVAMQWYPRFRYVSEQSSGIIIGAMVMRKSSFDALPAEVRTSMRSESRVATRQLGRVVRQADDRAYQAILSRGIRAVDLEPHRGAWQAVADRTREQLEGRLYSRQLLERVRNAVARR